jgi:ParB/RepB/Spo0J family partition protein
LEVFFEGDSVFVNDGHRRMIAVNTLLAEGVDIQGIPCITTTKNEEMRVFSLLTRNSGEKLSNLEKGDVFLRLLNYGYTQAQIAVKIGTSQANVSNFTALAKTPLRVQELLAENKIAENFILEALRKGTDEKALVEACVAAANAVANDSDANGGSVKRAVTRKAGESLGVVKITPAKQAKTLAVWLDENSLVKKGDEVYNTMTVIDEFVKGAITVEALYDKLKGETPVTEEKSEPTE